MSICLGSRYPIVLWWGKEVLAQFYNDAYIPVLGVTKHPGWSSERTSRPTRSRFGLVRAGGRTATGTAAGA